MKVEVFHASKFGNGVKVAEEFKRIMAAKGHQVNVHHIKNSKPKLMPAADLYIFGSPTRFGKPAGSMLRFLKKVILPSGAKYALFATHADEVADKETGRMPTQEELNQRRKNIPMMDELLRGKGFVKVADKVFSVGTETLKGPLKDGWQAKVEEFVAAIINSL